MGLQWLQPCLQAAQPLGGQGAVVTAAAGSRCKFHVHSVTRSPHGCSRNPQKEEQNRESEPEQVHPPCSVTGVVSRESSVSRGSDQHDPQHPCV